MFPLTMLMAGKRMCLLYYSVPVLTGVLTAEQMKNWSCLVYAIAILSQSCVTEEDVKVAADNLEEFCGQLSIVYPDEKQSYPFNFHIHRHLTLSVNTDLSRILVWTPLNRSTMKSWATLRDL